jgi:type I restriction enzyme S subunit
MALINKIKLSEIENFKDLSPEFYKAEYMKKSADIRKNKFRRLSQISYITDGEHGSPCWSDSSGIKYVTAEFIKENFIEQGITKQITFEQDRRNARARLKEGDILIYSVGAYAGLTCVAEPHLFPANIPRSVAIVRLNNNDEFYPEFISVFLNSNIGQFQSVRFRAGNSQPVLALEKIRQFEVPIFDNKIQSDIKALYQEAYKLRQQAQSLYKQATDLLETELGIDKISFEKPNKFISNFSDVVVGGRISSYFFQPKYNQLDNLLSNFQTTLLRKLVNYYSTGFAFPKKQILKEKTDAPLIKIANIKLMDLDISSSDFISNTGKLAGANETIKIGDILIGMSGSVGTSAVIREEKLAYINQRILRINSLGIIDPEYLALVINSLVGKMQFEKYGTGGVQVNISPRDMLNIKIPRLGVTEDKIADLIKKSFVAKKQSQQLLADAKARVEQLIEEAANNA